MKAINEQTPLLELAAIVSETPHQAGINAVLSGGAVVSIYSENAYQSYDLDFISSVALSDIAPALLSIGFTRGDGRHFVHPATRYLVEFPPGPVMVGEERVQNVAELRTEAGVIRLLSPTDSVKDRLAAFFHWSDRQALDQAVAIARCQPVDLREIERWAASEPQPAGERLRVFLQKFAS